MFEDTTAPQTTLAVTTSSRPKRVAFLINPAETNDKELDEIIRYSISVWGGKFHAIIPTTGAKIEPDWWKLLSIVDPDIIYSMISLNDILIKRINRYILPSKIIEVSPEDREQLSDHFRIDSFEIGALGVEDIPYSIWNTKRNPFFGEPFFLYIIGSHKDTPSIKFLLRNFGTLSRDGSMLTAFRDVPHETMDVEEVTPTDIIKRLLSADARTKVVVPNDLCQMDASHNYSLDHEPFNEAFHLVIGDDPLDLIYAWNRALTTTAIGRNLFWLSKDYYLDDKFLKMVGELIQKTFWSNNKTGKVISYSLDQNELEVIAEKMTPLAHFNFKPVKLKSDQFPCPNASPLVQGFSIGGYPYAGGSELHTEQILLSESKGLVRFPRPSFLVQGHSQTGWMVDLKIQYHPERYGYTNIRPSWQLPRKLGVADQFFSVDSSQKSRVVTGGLPSIEVETGDKTIRIHIPSDLDVVWTYLNRLYTNTNKKHPQPKSRFTELSTSDKGRYLRGLLRIFGNIFYAGRTFEDPFWRYVFIRMAGRPNFKDELVKRSERALEVLKSTLEEDPTPITAESPRINKLAEDLARNLTLRDPSPKVLTKNDIKQHFRELRGKALKEQSDNGWWRANKKFDEYKESELENRLEAGVILQGAELPCPHCGTRQWYVVDDLNSMVRCNGCFFRFSLPPEPKWSFRLNDLVLNALRKYGTLAVLQALYYFQNYYCIGGMFLFLPCQDIFEEDNRNPFTDLDLVFICEGKFHIGEVKSVPEGFEEQDFEKLRAIAEDLLPDVVLIVAPGENWPENVETEIRELEEALAPLEIKVEKHLLRWR